MNKLLLTISVMVCAIQLNAQAGLYFKLKTLIGQSHPEINLNQKLVAVNVWSVNDQESREVNKGFEKACDVYQAARLKGGLKGLVVVTVNKENLLSEAVITLTKDGIVKSIPFKLEELSAELSAYPVKNAVFDTNGNEVYKDLPSSAVFNSIHQLITR